MWGSKRVMRFLGIKVYRTLDHWLRSGLLSCAIPGDGTGNRRGWSAEDVARAFAVNALRRYGYSLQAIRGSGMLAGLTDEAIVSGVHVATVGNTIGAVPIDPYLTWKECVDCEHPPPVSVARWTTRHLSRDLPLDLRACVTIYVTDVYKSVSQQMKEESQAEVKHEHS